MAWGRRSSQTRSQLRRESQQRAIGCSAVPGVMASASLTASAKGTGDRGSGNEEGVPAVQLLIKRPVALLHLIPKPAVLFAAGAIAGAIGKTLTAPLDRVKLLLQVQGGYSGVQVTAAAKSGDLLQAFAAIGREEGLLAYWKGNIPQVVRVIPYSAAQLYAYEFFKHSFQDDKEKTLSVPRRLAAGACAGMVSTLATYPLDSIRLRLAVDPSIRGMAGACKALVAEGGMRAFYRGVGTSMFGIAPYLAIELAVFDSIPKDKVPAFARGFCAALLATGCCYPLDTIRRQMQMQSGSSALPVIQLVKRQIAEGGIQSLYRGFIPNALKNLPNKGIRLSVFDTSKKLLASSETAYEEELAVHRANRNRAARLGLLTASLGMNRGGKA